jgi:hypothetical protein
MKVVEKPKGKKAAKPEAETPPAKETAEATQ